MFVGSRRIDNRCEGDLQCCNLGSKKPRHFISIGAGWLGMWLFAERSVPAFGTDTGHQMFTLILVELWECVLDKHTSLQPFGITFERKGLCSHTGTTRTDSVHSDFTGSRYDSVGDM